jgi:uncharacterized membrane protein
MEDLRWKRYKAVGGEAKVAQLYRKYEIFTACRKVDLQFSINTLFTGLLYTSTNLGNVTARFAFGANIALVMVEVAWEVTGIFGVRKKDPWWLYAFWLLSLFLPMFIVSMAYDYWTENNVLRDATTEVSITVGVFALLGVLNRILTVIFSALLYAAFDQPEYAAVQRIIISGRAAFNRSRVKRPRPPRRQFAQGDASVIANPLSAAGAAAAGGTTPAMGAAAAAPSPSMLAESYGGDEWQQDGIENWDGDDVGGELEGGIELPDAPTPAATPLHGGARA